MINLKVIQAMDQLSLIECVISLVLSNFHTFFSNLSDFASLLTFGGTLALLAVIWFELES